MTQTLLSRKRTGATQKFYSTVVRWRPSCMLAAAALLAALLAVDLGLTSARAEAAVSIPAAVVTEVLPLESDTSCGADAPEDVCSLPL
jgi:hypothetical protein